MFVDKMYVLFRKETFKLCWSYIWGATGMLLYGWFRLGGAKTFILDISPLKSARLYEGVVSICRAFMPNEKPCPTLVSDPQPPYFLIKFFIIDTAPAR